MMVAFVSFAAFIACNMTIGLAVMLSWNWLIAPSFEIQQLTYAQAVAAVFLKELAMSKMSPSKDQSESTADLLSKIFEAFLYVVSCCLLFIASAYLIKVIVL